MEPHIKRPQNSFMIWSNEVRESIARSNPDKNNGEISRILGTIWNNMDDESKLHYKRLSENIKKEHKIMYPEYKYRPNKNIKNRIVKEDNLGFMKIPVLQKARAYKKKKVYVKKTIIKHDDEHNDGYDDGYDDRYDDVAYGDIVEPDYFTELQNFYTYRNFECCL